MGLGRVVVALVPAGVGAILKGECHMKPATMGAAALLTVVSLAHLMRILFGLRVTVADRHIPMWLSGVAFLVAGGLAIMLWRSARKGGSG